MIFVLIVACIFVPAFMGPDLLVALGICVVLAVCVVFLGRRMQAKLATGA